MADEIVQQLGFDATQALDALSQLDGALQSVEQRLKSFAQTCASFSGSNVANAAAQIGQAFSSNIPAATQHVERLTVSWGFLTLRILYTQTVVSAFQPIPADNGRGWQSAVEYEKRVAEITTISNLSQGGAGSIVRGLADQYNIPLLEEAAGLYQVLSHGIQDTTEATNVLSEANKFAKATNSSMADSVNLLLGAVKSFGMSTTDAGKAAGVLFEAVHQGRLRRRIEHHIRAGWAAGGRIGPVARRDGRRFGCNYRQRHKRCKRGDTVRRRYHWFDEAYGEYDPRST